MAVGETTDDTKGVNNMWYVILSLVVGGILTGACAIMAGNGIRDFMKEGFKPDGADIITFAVFTHVSFSLFASAIYCLIGK